MEVVSSDIRVLKIKMKADREINSAVLIIIALSGYIENCLLKHFCGGVYYVVQGSSGVFVCIQKPKVRQFK